MNNLESDDESVDTPLVSPFPHSDNDSDDCEVLNEMIEYENVGMLRRERAINSRKAYLLKDKQIPIVRVFDEVVNTWMAFRGNTRDLGSFGEEIDKITDLNQISCRFLHTVRGDGIVGIKRRRRDLSGDSVRNLAMTSGRGRLKEDLESSTWRWCQHFKATSSQPFSYIY
ncbi:hypothetical protein Tco_0704687 [Tanacetum coccineum]|uniref:Uncharacterized protein n=1 Tax=Tanacetum coccineum TaxID=301880 RepID=A0ABQ4Y2P4_9ASTR